MKKRSDDIRHAIGTLVYEQQVYQSNGNDEQHDILQKRIDKLRKTLIEVEFYECGSDKEE